MSQYSLFDHVHTSEDEVQFSDLIPLRNSINSISSTLQHVTSDSTKVTVDENLVVNGTVKLSNTNGFSAQLATSPSLGTNVSWNLPTSDSASCLSSNGSGSLGWTNPVLSVGIGSNLTMSGTQNVVLGLASSLSGLSSISCSGLLTSGSLSTGDVTINGTCNINTLSTASTSIGSVTGSTVTIYRPNTLGISTMQALTQIGNCNINNSGSVPTTTNIGNATNSTVNIYNPLISGKLNNITIPTSTSTFCTLTDPQTLTNKTLTAPSISGGAEINTFGSGNTNIGNATNTVSIYNLNVTNLSTYLYRCVITQWGNFSNVATPLGGTNNVDFDTSTSANATVIDPTGMHNLNRTLFRIPGIPATWIIRFTGRFTDQSNSSDAGVRLLYNNVQYKNIESWCYSNQRRVVHLEALLVSTNAGSFDVSFQMVNNTTAASIGISWATVYMEKIA